MQQQEIIPHLFRTEYSKLVAVLCKRFGFDEVETAEDLASETFLAAAQTWAMKGLPPNPVAWLYNVAKNKAKNHLQRATVFDNKVAPVVESNVEQEYELDLSLQNINDSQLQMMFAVCHPSIGTEAQIGLSLRILCGFGIEEIADAFLTNKETITKRLFRAKEKLRELKVVIEMPDAAGIAQRLPTVLTTIYLLFTEGYYSITHNEVLRRDLCLEAMRLCYMLVENENTNTREANALLSLMCFHASRFDARMNANGEMILYEEQDTNLWNDDLISKGMYFLHCASGGDRVSKYHLEATIAYWNTHKEDTKEKWEHILQLYNRLLQIAYSPIAALNRTFALAKARGKELAIIEAEKLQLTTDHFYYALLGELYTGINHDKAITHYQQALALAKTQTDRHTIQKKIDKLQ